MTYRNRALLDLARGQACVACHANDGTIVAAHSNLSEHGRGYAHKAHDWAIMFLCFECHSLLDSRGVMSSADRRNFIYEMIARTHGLLWMLGLVKVA